MEIILLERITNLGKLGDLVTVKPGYARNYLFPSGKATIANPNNIKNFEATRTEYEKKASDALTQAEGRARQISELEISIRAKSADEGKLFGSISPSMIAEAMSSAGVKISKKEIQMSNGSIRQLGEYEINFHLHPEVNQKLTIHIIAE